MPMRLGHVPALDGLRGVAIAAVIGLHFFGLSGGFYGVDLFFVLSGFLITTLLLEEHDRRGAIRLLDFYERRARRLFPALWVLLATVAVAGAAVYSVPKLVVMIGASLFYSVNLARAFASVDIFSGTPVTHLWSLAQEEQFYLVWPLVLILLLRRLSERRMFHVALVAAVVLISYRILLASNGAGWHRLYYGPDTHADGLVIGCAAAFARRRGARARGWQVAVPVLAFAVVFGKETVAWSEYGLPLVEVACAVLILAALGPLSQLLSLRPLAYVGVLSYSLYLWQDFALWVTGWTEPWPALGLAVALTLVSYYLVERPFRRRRRVGREAVSALPVAETGG